MTVHAQSCGTPDPTTPFTAVCTTAAGQAYTVTASFSWGELAIGVMLAALIGLTLLRLTFEVWQKWSA